MFDILYGRLFLVRVVMLLAMFGLVATGIAVIYAIGHPAEMTAGQDEWVGEFAGRWEKQVIFAVAGLLGLVLINIIDYRILGPYAQIRTSSLNCAEDQYPSITKSM